MRNRSSYQRPAFIARSHLDNEVMKCQTPILWNPATYLNLTLTMEGIGRVGRILSTTAMLHRGAAVHSEQ
jgi:hypothetical protein